MGNYNKALSLFTITALVNESSDAFNAPNSSYKVKCCPGANGKTKKLKRKKVKNYFTYS